MSLPKIEYPVFSLIQPSTQKKIEFRPFTVKEEKILLIAEESQDPKDKLRAMRQIISNCCLNLEEDVASLPSFDTEYMFIKIRSKSVSNEVTLNFRDEEDDRIYEFEVDLDEIQIKFDDNHKTDIKLNDQYGIVMKYPTYEMLENLDLENSEFPTLEMASKCISILYDLEGDRVYNMSEYSNKEIVEFLESILRSDFKDSILNFFETMPVLSYKIEYTNSAGTERTIILNSVSDFFQWQ